MWLANSNLKFQQKMVVYKKKTMYTKEMTKLNRLVAGKVLIYCYIIVK